MRPRRRIRRVRRTSGSVPESNVPGAATSRGAVSAAPLRRGQGTCTDQPRCESPRRSRRRERRAPGRSCRFPSRGPPTHPNNRPSTVQPTCAGFRPAALRGPGHSPPRSSSPARRRQDSWVPPLGSVASGNNLPVPRRRRLASALAASQSRERLGCLETRERMHRYRRGDKPSCRTQVPPGSTTPRAHRCRRSRSRPKLVRAECAARRRGLARLPSRALALL